jgi:hypothetical protein
MVAFLKSLINEIKADLIFLRRLGKTPEVGDKLPQNIPYVDCSTSRDFLVKSIESNPGCGIERRTNYLEN